MVAERSSDGSPIPLTITGAKFTTTSCSGNATLAIGSLVQVLSFDGGICDPAQAMALFTSTFIAAGVDDLVSIRDDNGNSMAEALAQGGIVVPLSITTTKGLPVTTLQLNITTTIGGFGNVSASARMVPTFKNIGEFAAQVAVITELPQSIINVTYDDATGDLRSRIRFSYKAPVIKGELALGVDLDPIVSAEVDGGISITASFAIDFVLGANLRPPPTSITTLCRWNVPDELPMIDSTPLLLNLTINNNDPLKVTAPFVASYLKEPDDLVQVLSSLLPPTVTISKIESTSLGMLGVSFTTTATSNIRSILINPWGANGPAILIGCDVQTQKVKAPAYLPFIENALVTGEDRFALVLCYSNPHSRCLFVSQSQYKWSVELCIAKLWYCRDRCTRRCSPVQSVSRTWLT
jgi:hypothetical protein